MLVVFAGPSLAPAAVRDAVAHADVRPPACRGDVAAATAQGASTILLIDGGFAHRLAVSPSELIAAMRAGVQVIGAASLGAIRAAECAPAGMRGVGAVTALYRWGVVRDDDEVAVAVEPDRDHRASSVALINVRFAVLAALRAARLDRAQAAQLLAAARATHFSERQWRPILAAAGRDGDAELLALCHGADVKRRDAELAVARVAALPLAAAVPREPVAPKPRYPGHDPCFGESQPVLAAQLHRRLAGSGRARRLWPAGMPADPQTIWRDLAARHELAVELMRLYAVQRHRNLSG